MDKLNIELVKRYISEGYIDWSKHCLLRIQQRGISIQEIKQSIQNGEILEYYENDYPLPSCLILCFNMHNQALHIVCGVGDNIVVMVTAYYPNDEEWEEDKKRRKE